MASWRVRETGTYGTYGTFWNSCAVCSQMLEACSSKTWRGTVFPWTLSPFHFFFSFFLTVTCACVPHAGCHATCFMFLFPLARLKKNPTRIGLCLHKEPSSSAYHCAFILPIVVLFLGLPKLPSVQGRAYGRFIAGFVCNQHHALQPLVFAVQNPRGFQKFNILVFTRHLRDETRISLRFPSPTLA